MEKEELLNKIAEAFGADNKEIKIAYDAFLHKISDELLPEEAVKIPDFGVFQIKSKIAEEQDEHGYNKGSNPSYRLLFYPDSSNEVVELDFSFSGKSKKNSPESAFSLSTHKPIIPILESQKKELMIQSSYINLLNDFKEKADDLFIDAVKLDNFDVGIDKEVKPDIFIHVDDVNIDESNEPEEIDDSIPWNFGDVLNDELKHQDVIAEPEQTDNLKDLNFNPLDFPDEHPAEEENLNSTDKPENEEVTSDAENVGQENNQNQDLDIDINSLGDDFFNLSASDLGIEDVKSDEKTITEAEEPAEQVESGEETDEVESYEDEENGEEETDEEGIEEEETDGKETVDESKDQNDVISIDVNKAHEFSSSRAIPLEEAEGPDDVDDHYSKWFWAVLLALVFITGCGIYYFFFYTSAEQNNVPLTAKAKKVQPQVIERDYQVPVSVIPRSNEESSDKATDNTSATNMAANTQPKVDNSKTEKAASEKTTPEKTAPEKITKEKTTVTVPGQVNEKAAKNKAVSENVKPTQQPGVDQVKGENTASQFERKDNKNTLVKNFIFSDGNKYTIQLSSWKSKEIAEKEVRRLRKQGLDAYFTESYVPSVGGTWYRVRVGEFYTIQGAENALEKIK